MHLHSRIGRVGWFIGLLALLSCEGTASGHVATATGEWQDAGDDASSSEPWPMEEPSFGPMEAPRFGRDAGRSGERPSIDVDAGDRVESASSAEIPPGACASLTSRFQPPTTDRYDSFPRSFFRRYCERCHSSALENASARSGAPPGTDWDEEQAVRGHLPEIRVWVGVLNGMPIGDPLPSCDERERLVRWIDSGAP